MFVFPAKPCCLARHSNVTKGSHLILLEANLLYQLMSNTAASSKMCKSLHSPNSSPWNPVKCVNDSSLVGCLDSPVTNLVTIDVLPSDHQKMPEKPLKGFKLGNGL